MLTDWAFFWGTIANVDIATVAALPNGYAITLENDAFFDIFEEFLIASFMLSFDFANFFEKFGDFFKTFFASFGSEFDIHLCFFVVFAFNSILEVFSGIWDATVMKDLIPNFGMLFFVVASLFEDASDMLIAVFLGLLA